MTDPLKTISTRQTPQDQPIPGTVPNSAGGYSFAVDKWGRLNRFLILGTQGGSYYASEKKLTKENADVVFACIAADGPATVDIIVDISVNGRNPKQGPVLFALAACSGAADQATRSAALAAIPKVCRTGTMLFQFVGYAEQFRGWGRGMREAVAKWYTERSVSSLAMQVAKYQQREGWGHRDLLRLSKPRPARGEGHDQVLKWAVGKDPEPTFPFLAAVEDIKTAPLNHAVTLVTQHKLPWEVVPDHLMNEPKMLAALVEPMGITALVRQLSRLTATGTIKSLGGQINLDKVIDKLTDEQLVKDSRIHPLTVLVALKAYEKGKGRHLDWSPIPRVVDALNDTFKLAFGNVVPSNKRTLIALDTSASMTWSTLAGTELTPSVGSIAMALVTAVTEPEYHIMAFSHQLVNIPGITAKSSLQAAMAATAKVGGGGTDCSLPMTTALKAGWDVEHFVVYTDNETWAGRQHPVQALKAYRDKQGIPARLTVVGMVSNGFSIADPNDAGMLDVVGFDTAAPQLIADFGGGRI
jgi:60 kDa SS-A/Ro ribonucleoprotein